MHATRIGHADTLDTDDLIAAYVAVVPTLRLNFVASVDGAASVDGRSAGLGTSADKKVFGILRQLCDGLIVGAGTVRDEHYGPVRASDEQRAWRLCRRASTSTPRRRSSRTRQCDRSSSRMSRRMRSTGACCRTSRMSSQTVPALSICMPRSRGCATSTG